MEPGSTTSDDRPGDSDDDAPWRPGFDGWDGLPADGSRPLDRGVVRSTREADHGWSREHDEAEREPWVPVRPVRSPPPKESTGPPIAEVDDAPPPAVTGQIILVGIGVACLVALGVLVVVAIRPAGFETSSTTTAPLVPEQIDQLWSTDVGSPVVELATGADVLLVRTSPGSDLLAFDLLTGAERWVHSADDLDRVVDRMAVIDDTVVVQQRGQTAASIVTALDVGTGAERWSSDDESSYNIVDVDDGHAILRRFREEGRTRAEVIDPVTGAAVGDSVVVSDVSVPGPYLAEEPERRKASVWSIESGSLGGPAVDSFNLRTIAPLDGGVVGLDLDARIVAFDADGNRIDERPFVSDAFGEFTSRADLVGVVDDADLGIIGSGSSIGFTVRDGAIETVWERPGRAFRPVVTAAGPLSVLVGPDESGEINDTIIDAASGETVAETDVGVTRESEPLLGDNAYVVAPEVGAPERVVTAHRYDGSELWSLTIPTAAEYHVAGGLVAVTDHGAGRSTVTVSG